MFYLFLGAMFLVGAWLNGRPETEYRWTNAGFIRWTAFLAFLAGMHLVLG